MPTINVNNADFYYELQGRGNPLIFISGYTSDHSLWAQQVEPLSKYFQVLTFDNRAVGQTKDDGCELSAELMADDVIALADALGLEKSHIIGSSMGGTIAQQAAIRHPDKVGKLGLMVTTAKWRSAVLKGISVGIAMREADMPFDVQFDSVLGWVFGEAFINNADNVNFLKELVLNDPHPQSLDNQKRQAVVLNNFDSRNDLQKITAPTLVMNGSEDILSLPEESQHLVDNIANAKPHTFNCAHAISAEQPAELIKVILDFFS